jgi:Protein of unknown function (DUF2378)
MTERIFYSVVLTNILKASGADQNPALLVSLQTRFKLDANDLPPTIPFDQFVPVVDYVRQYTLPYLSENEGWQKLGYETGMVYFEGAGKINKMVLGMFGIEDAMRIFLQMRQIAIPFGRHEIDLQKPGHFIYHTYDIPVQPYFVFGQIQAGMESAGVTEYKFNFSQPAPEETIIEVKYTPRSS